MNDAPFLAGRSGRAARDDDGNTYQVPSDMTYTEWRETFVGSNFTVKAKDIDNAELLFRDKKDSSLTAKQRYEDTVEVAKAYKNLPVKVKTDIPDVTFEFGYSSNACDIDNKIIHVGIGTTEEAINHEYGHLIEKYMMNAQDVDAYKKYLTEGLTIKDIVKETYYDSFDNPVEIFVLKGNRFESEYQSRLYIKDLSEAVNADGSINGNYLYECISEPFRKYMNHEPISDRVLRLIEGAIL